MPDIAQHSVNELSLARAIEPVAVAAWPARETMSLNCWLLRFSDGYSSRANSVSPLEFDGDLSDAIESVEAAYRARKLVPQFQISPATVPLGLQAALIARGYRHRTPTFLMIADAAGVAGPVEDVQILSNETDDFARLTREGSHSDADGTERLATLERVTSPKAYVVVQAKGDAVACGASVVIGDWASVYVMRTSPAHRRMGHAQRVLAAIANWARERGATRLYLQVDEVNTAARRLYARAGFANAYRYFHYYAPETSK